MRKKVGLLLALTIILGASVPSFALDLVQTSYKDADQQIYLLFDKNVVNFTVKENNLKCFSLRDGHGKPVPFEVIFADEQIEPEKKREIIVKPKAALARGTVYELEVFPYLQSKNGENLGKKVIISLVTAAK